MPRTARQTPGGYVYHVLNRGTARLKLFRKAADYDAFRHVLQEALDRYPTRLLAYCVMPTHWHLVLWPERDDQLSELMRWLTLTHSVRWQAHHQSQGSGHLYQNRFKAFPIAEDEHLYAVLRYVERNALRAGLVRRAEDWRWSSLADRLLGGEAAEWLAAWPVPMPDDWLRRVNAAQSDAELEAIRTSVIRGRPYGSESWVECMVQRLGLQATVRPRGRPRKHPTEGGAPRK